MDATTEQPWTLDHHLYVLQRTEARPLPTNAEGDQWMEHRHTGKVTVVCACGYTTGLVDTTDVPSLAVLSAEHASTMDAFTRLGRIA